MVYREYYDDTDRTTCLLIVHVGECYLFCFVLFCFSLSVITVIVAWQRKWKQHSNLYEQTLYKMVDSNSNSN